MMGSAGITNVGPINTPTTNTGAIAGFDPIMKWSKKKERRKKQESAGKQWVRRRDDPNHIDGRSKAARKLLKRISKRKKKMSEAFIQESGEATKQRAINSSSSAAEYRRSRSERSVLPTGSKRSKRLPVLSLPTIRRRQRIARRKLDSHWTSRRSKNLLMASSISRV